MASHFDPTEFVDSDFHPQKSAYAFAEALNQPPRAPTKEEVDSRVVEAQQKLAHLKRAQEQLERERAALEETRRRQMEFHTGREEMTQNLVRGITLLEEAEFNARRDAEQMARILDEFRGALKQLENIQEESWTQENFSTELTRALTAVENARMEWNAARLKVPILNGPAQPNGTANGLKENHPAAALVHEKFWHLCRLGLAFTWPLLLAMGGIIGLLVALLVRR